MHRAGYVALGLNYVYAPFAISDLPAAVLAVRALGIRGVGVSMPFKLEAMTLVDAIDPTARRIGAINTIVNDDGRLTGHNTDWIGAMRALEEVAILAGKRVLVLGAGGAARAIAFGLSERGAQTTIANRDMAKAESLASEVGADAAPMTEATRARDYDVVINATSVGMAEVSAESPIPPSAIQEGMVVMDIVYKPMVTELVRTARAQGATAIHGGRMLLHQAARQFELYTALEAPLDAMNAALDRQLGAG